MSEPVMEPTRVVIVLGMHRSGTSILTRALAAIGVYLGDRLMPGSSDNPKGFFEDLDVMAINLDLLAELGCNWDSVLIPDWQTLSEDRQYYYLQKAAALVRERFGTVKLWGFKDPRVTRLISFWCKVLDMVGCQPVLVASNRHPLSVAASLAKRDQMPRGQALALWIIHQSIVLETLSQQGGLVVDYDLLLENPGLQLHRLSHFLAIPVSPGSQEEIDFTKQFLDISLRHSQYQRDGSDLGNDVLGRLCRQLYKHLQEWSEIKDIVPEFLRMDATNLIDQVKNYCTQQEPLLNTLDSLVTRNYKLDEQHHHLSQQHHKLINEHSELSTQYHDLLGQHSELSTQYHDLLGQHSELSIQYHDLLRQHSELSTQYHDLLGQNNELIWWSEKLWDENCSWITQFEKTRQNMAILNTRLRDAEFRVLRCALKKR